MPQSISYSRCDDIDDEWKGMNSLNNNILNILKQKSGLLEM